MPPLPCRYPRSFGWVRFYVPGSRAFFFGLMNSYFLDIMILEWGRENYGKQVNGNPESVNRIIVRG